MNLWTQNLKPKVKLKMDIIPQFFDIISISLQKYEISFLPCYPKQSCHSTIPKSFGHFSFTKSKEILHKNRVTRSRDDLKSISLFAQPILQLRGYKTIKRKMIISFTCFVHHTPIRRWTLLGNFFESLLQYLISLEF